ncbi:hypothetical protein OV203_32670 [Nannocystis sp. ILAH1]|uniref:hypothetical protein n=1 Tax=unclassified Nannocystis TaxID=2627009 RepID=UPI00227214A3|nr:MULTISPECIES: hypothetical protein [unclassified Nannocystis]MCY0991937.1 hypothetical protein [Nannocystis sp. ILAH1]MCY1064187.1 hypothetical protein [Nannocystis sp. RBIL2]
MPEEHDAPATALELVGQHRVELRRDPAVDTLELFGRDGKVVLAIEVRETGPVLRFEGAGLTLKAAGELVLDAKKLTLRSEEALSLSTGGDLELIAAGDLRSTARVQTITAELGDVRVEANDDVRIDGERVLVNC